MPDNKKNELVYVVDLDLKPLLDNQQKLNRELDNVESSFNKTTKTVDKTSSSFGKLNKSGAAVSAALAMPEVDRLTKRLSELSGKIGVNSNEMKSATIAANRHGSALSTVSSALGTTYIGSVGRSTSELIKQASAAVSATEAQIELSKAALEEAQALQVVSAELVKKMSAEKAAATESVRIANESIERLEESIDATYESERAILRRTQADYEAAKATGNATLISSRKNDVDKQTAKIKQLEKVNTETLTQAENKLTAAKQAEYAASQKLVQATAAEASAKKVLASANEAVAMAQSRVTLAAKAQSAALAGLKSVYALLGGPTGVILLAAAGIYALYQAMSNNQAIDDYHKKLDGLKDSISELTEKQAKALQQRLLLKVETDTKELEKAKAEIGVLTNAINKAKNNKIEIPISLSGATIEIDISGYVDEWRKKLTDLGGVAEDTANQIDKNTKKAQEAARIAKENEGLTQDEIAAKKLLTAATKSLTESNDKLFDSLHLNDVVTDETAAIDALTKEFEKAGLGSDLLNAAITDLKAKFDENRSLKFETELKAIEQNVSALKIEMEKGAAAAVEYRATLDATSKGYNVDDAKEYANAKKEEYLLQQKISKQRKEINKSSGGGDNQAAKKIAELKSKIDSLSIGYREGTREQEVYAAVQSLGAKATQQQKDKVAELAGALYDATQKQKDLNAAEEANTVGNATKARDEALAQLQRQQNLGVVSFEQAERRKLEIAANYSKAIAEAQAASAVTPQQELAGQIDPVQQLENELNQKIALIRAYEAERVVTAEQAEMLITAAKNVHMEQERAAREELFRQQSEFNAFTLDMIDAMGQRATNAITGLILKTQTLSDAFINLGATILNQAVGALVQMGAQYYKNLLIQDSVEAAEKARAAANGVAYTSAVSAQVATTSALAAQNAYAATAAIPIVGPGLAPAAAATASAAAAGFGTPAIASAPLAGARYNGGPVSAGSMYRVGEKGKPEIMQADNGNQYMIPGDNGRVISNKDLQGAGGSYYTINQTNTYYFQGSADDPETLKEFDKVAYAAAERAIKDNKRPNGLLYGAGR